MLEYEQIRPEIVKLYEEADVMGKKIYKSGIVTPAEIFDKFHSGLRRGPSIFRKELLKF